MRSGQGCVHTCTLPGEVYQVQQLLAALEVAMSLILSDEEVESIWCVGMFFRLWTRFVVKLVNLNLSFFIYFFYWLFDLLSVQCFHCLLVGQPESMMSGAVWRESLSKWSSTSKHGSLLPVSQNLKHAGWNWCVNVLLNRVKSLD